MDQTMRLERRDSVRGALVQVNFIYCFISIFMIHVQYMYFIFKHIFNNQCFLNFLALLNHVPGVSICLFPALRPRIWDHWLCGFWLLIVSNKARIFFFYSYDNNDDDDNDVEDNDVED